MVKQREISFSLCCNKITFFFKMKCENKCVFIAQSMWCIDLKCEMIWDRILFVYKIFIFCLFGFLLSRIQFLEFCECLTFQNTRTNTNSFRNRSNRKRDTIHMCRRCPVSSNVSFRSSSFWIFFFLYIFPSTSIYLFSYFILSIDSFGDASYLGWW